MGSFANFKVDVEKAVECLLKSIDIYTDMGRFTMAAKYHQSIAEMYESDPNTLNKTIQHYEQAADYFKGEESISSANKCMLKVAQYAAQMEDYEKAISIYEQVLKIKTLFRLGNIYKFNFLPGGSNFFGKFFAQIQC